ncbi:MAG TPA: hypothetical protein VFW87_16785 [Pirellulales bacterium]|nr:hypothetical protein [Pirellulales bacterium]
MFANFRCRNLRSAGVVLCCLGLMSLGCGQRSIHEYVPNDAAARAALTTALDAWKSGKAPDKIGASGPAVQAQDTQWRDGQKLVDYEIVGPAPAVAEDPNRRYTVKLTLAGAAEPRETIYIVVGKDPVFVFSQTSYQQLSGQ